MRITTALLGLLFTANCVAAQPPTWKAGAAKVVITPGQSMWMSGYGARVKPSEGKETELYAKALVLEDATGKRSLLVTLDLVGVGRPLSLEICRGLQTRFKLPREAVTLSVSHTHCGPVVGHNLGSMYFLDDEQARRVGDYAVWLPGRVYEVAERAIANLEPVHVSWSIGATGFAVNRRENKEAEVPKLKELGQIKGPHDHDVPVLAIRDLNKKLKAVAFGYACHATVLSWQKWCGDYPGFAMAAVEDTHPGAVALFWAGCGADQNPLPRRTVELARAYGKQLADEVDRVLAAPMKPLTPTCRHAYVEVDLPLGDPPTRETLVEDSRSTNKFLASRAKTLLKELETAGNLKTNYPYPVQTWRLGDDLTWIMLGGEVVVDYSLRLKKELGPGKTWVMGYANDVMAYIPSLRVLKEGGYEGGGAMVYYGLPCAWSPRVEEIIIEAVHRTKPK